MKSLDYMISEIASPYDEIGKTQTELQHIAYNNYQKDAIVDCLSKRDSKITFDLFFDDVISKMDLSEKNEFLRRCFNKLSLIYSLDFLKDYLDRNCVFENKPGEVISFIKFFVYDEWIDVLGDCLPKFSLDIFKNIEKISSYIKEHFSEIQNKIILKSNVDPLFKIYFNYASLEDGVKTIDKLVRLDLSGIISRQILISK